MVATNVDVVVAAAAAATTVYVAANAIASVGIDGASAICVDGAADDVTAGSTIVVLVADDAIDVVSA